MLEVNDPPLDLRDHLLGDDDDVAVLEASRPTAGVGEESRQIVTALELGEAGSSGITRTSPGTLTLC